VSLAARVERLARHRYVFLSTWWLAAPQAAIFDALRDLWSYPTWWPQFIAARQLDEDTGEFALRSSLPLTLRFTLCRDVEDPRAGLLRATASGDICGTVQWQLHDVDGDRVRADFEQRVTLEYRPARWIDPIARPLLTWNHRQAMRSGQDGLRNYLSTRHSG
jgi:hypothetical protein